MTVRPRLLGGFWHLCKDFEDYVSPVSGQIALCVGGHRIVTDQATARLLAKRINECLDAKVRA